MSEIQSGQRERIEIQILDTTLRDGAQSPGAALKNGELPLEFAHLARAAKISVVEAGFPAASVEEAGIVRRIAEEYKRSKVDGFSPVVAALAQLRPEQIDKTMDALRPAIEGGIARLHVYLPVDPVLMEVSLGQSAKDRRKLIERLDRAVRQAVAADMQVQFSPEGYSNVGANFDFTTELIKTAIGAGARIINCPDTKGSSSPNNAKSDFVPSMNRHAEIMAREFPGVPIIWSTHCHNDRGLAVPNSLRAVFEGPARQVEGCINGIGERAGNAAIEQIVVNLLLDGPTHPRGDFFTEVSPHLQALSDFVARHMLPRQPHTPITGENAYTHTSGGHTNAVLKNAGAYQGVPPEMVGRKVSLVFGPSSGGNHALSIVTNAGFECPKIDAPVFAQFVKEYYPTRRKGVTDQEVVEAYFAFRAPLKVTSFEYGRAGGKVHVRPVGKYFDQVEAVFSEDTKDSPFSVLARALKKELGEFEVQNFEQKGNSQHGQARTKVVLSFPDGRTYEAAAEDSDIENAALMALMTAFNRAFVTKHYTVERK